MDMHIPKVNFFLRDDSGSNSPVPEAGSPVPVSDNSTPRTGKRPTSFKAIAKLVSWSVKSKISDGKSRSPVPDGFQTTSKMRRCSTLPEVQKDAASMRLNAAASKPKRKSVSVIYGNNAERAKTTSYLLSLALKEEIHKRRLMEKFRFLIRLRVLLHRWWKRHSLSEVNQTHPFYMQYQMINDLTDSTTAESGIDFKASYFKANKQRKMSQEARRILTMSPSKRSKDEIYYAMIALRGIDSIADYPLRMQQALATHGRFQCFGPKRFIVKQGHTPDNFYFILYGTVVVATLDSGEPYAKTRVTLRRGENFGAEELAIAHRIPRQSTVLTMEYTEFLTIDCDTYENIFMAGGVKTIHDPDHSKFMESLFFFKEWPLEKLQTNPKAMEFCYFRRNTVMVKDSNASEWIYIVKSGSLRVYKKLQKCYPKVNKRTGNFAVRAHTDGYQSFISDQSEYNRFAMYNNLDLPPALSPDSDSDDELHSIAKGVSEEKENLLSLPLMMRVERLIRPRTAAGGVIATYGHSTVKRNLRSAKSEGSKSRRCGRNAHQQSATPRTISSFSTTTDDKMMAENTTQADDNDGNGKRTLMDDFEGTAGLKASKLEDENSPSSVVFSTGALKSSVEPRQAEDADKPNTDINPSAISTRHQAFVTDLKHNITPADLDPEFVLIQTLTKGQAFGLQQMFIENQPSMVLISGGAECVMLNKKFYKENINPNVIQRLKQQLSPYPTDEELQSNLQTRVNWMEYRKITVRSLMAQARDGKPPRTNHKDKRPIFKQ